MTDKYFRTVVEVEILSAGDAQPPSDLDLRDIANAIDNGPYSGAILRQDSWEITREHMAEALKMHASDPGFLIVDYDEDNELAAELLATYSPDELRLLLANPTTVREDLLETLS